MADSRLPEAVRAAKAGQQEQARTLLLQIVEEDESNELAWLWLSGVVETDEDRRVCLENVLALNPRNDRARRGLEKLGEAQTAAQPAQAVVRQEMVPVSPAAAVLYPERQVREWQPQDTTPLKQVELPDYSSESTYVDVWNSDKELCPYCAAVLDFDAKRCKQCGRNLIASYFRHEKASANLIIYWVLLLGAAQLHLAQGILSYINAPNELAPVFFYGLIALALAGLTAAVAMRQFWAYVVSVILLSLLLSLTILRTIDGEGVGQVINQLIGDETTRELAEGITVPLVGEAVGLIRILLLSAIILALAFGIFFVGPDFARETKREIAEVGKGQRFASDYYGHGQRHAKQGRWATAVLYFQRATAQEPQQVYYQRALGQAYAVLGFYERSLDVLESGLKMASNSALRAELTELIRRVREYQAKTS